MTKSRNISTLNGACAAAMGDRACLDSAVLEMAFFDISDQIPQHLNTPWGLCAEWVITHFSGSAVLEIAFFDISDQIPQHFNI